MSYGRGVVRVELPDLTLCEKELIHSPGAIQPHGAMLAVLIDRRTVTHASANLDQIFGSPIEDVLGSSLEQAIGEPACRQLLESLSRVGQGRGQYLMPKPNGGFFQLQAHLTLRHICIDIEPIAELARPASSILKIQQVFESFQDAIDIADLCNLAVRGLKDVTEYDRVIAYKFAKDGHIEVIAEAREASLDPCLGLRYPASDLPAQARRQYLIQRVGGVADSSYVPVPLICFQPLDDGLPLDLTRSSLRSVSPSHRQYMRNMKTAASLAIGLAHGSSLWGMLVCHHRTPRAPGPELRAVADTVGQVVSLLLDSLSESNALGVRLQRETALRSVVELLAGNDISRDAFAKAERDLLTVVDAIGAIIYLSGNFYPVGQLPGQSSASLLLKFLVDQANGDVLALDDIALRYPQFADCARDGAGALLLPLSENSQDAILWFRPEMSKTVSWAGNPYDNPPIDPISGYPSPRASFAIWKETVKGHSEPWGKADIEIARAIRASVAKTQSEIALYQYAEQERLFKAAIESSNDAIVIMSVDGRIMKWNRAAESLFEFSAEEAIGEHINIVVPVGLHQEVSSILDKIKSGGGVQHHETVRVSKSGRQIDVSLSVSAIKSETGEILGATKVARDITEKNLARLALNDSERIARGIVETSLDAFLQLNEKGVVVDWSRKAEDLFGWPQSEAVGRYLRDFIVPPEHCIQHLERIADVVSRVDSKDSGVRFEVPSKRRDGTTIDTEVSLTVFRRRGGYVINAFIRDIAERKASEQQLRQAQKMESIGQLSGGIAHDFNNLLTVITGTIDVLADAVADKPRLAEIASMIGQAAERGADLTRRLLAFARKQPLLARETNIEELLRDFVAILRPTVGQHIEIEVMVAEDIWVAFIDPPQLTAALLNLAINANHAMPDGGKLTIKASNVIFGKNHAQNESDDGIYSYVMIEVVDTGTGIPASLKERVFDPFFTTKDVGKGTGLGLSMVYGFIKQSGGKIELDSEEGRGTTFRVYLPKAEQSPRTLVREVEQSLNQTGSETILIVEDDLLVRTYVVAQMTILGYRTLTASNAEEALGILAAGTHFDLLFTDIVMPGAINGRKLAEQMKKRNPAMKVLFTSGYFDETSGRDGGTVSSENLLSKPYRAKELAGALRAILDSPSPTRIS